MLRIIFFSTLQAFFLALGQVFLKLAMTRMPAFCFTAAYFRELFTNLWFTATGVSMGIATVLWLYIIKRFEFSIAYPATGIAYIFGMFAAIFVFHESVSLWRLTGILLITVGVILIVK
ncbi:MAG: EamA family transporter [Dysgonamonadaceae bacterium]|jgi:undecaprenyl phosphate-alpha-L-ara4N flippase subunit ArnE|nr:EamA family transporter [Dysgonamonadaceae bacterium]